MILGTGYHMCKFHVEPIEGTELDVFELRFVNRRWWRFGSKRWRLSREVTLMSGRNIEERHGGNWTLGSDPDIIRGLRFQGRPWNSTEPIEVHVKVGAHIP